MSGDKRPPKFDPSKDEDKDRKADESQEEYEQRRLSRRYAQALRQILVNVQESRQEKQKAESGKTTNSGTSAKIPSDNDQTEPKQLAIPTEVSSKVEQMRKKLHTSPETRVEEGATVKETPTPRRRIRFDSATTDSCPDRRQTDGSGKYPQMCSRSTVKKKNVIRTNKATELRNAAIASREQHVQGNFPQTPVSGQPRQSRRNTPSFAGSLPPPTWRQQQPNNRPIASPPAEGQSKDKCKPSAIPDSPKKKKSERDYQRHMVDEDDELPDPSMFMPAASNLTPREIQMIQRQRVAEAMYQRKTRRGYRILEQSDQGNLMDRIRYFLQSTKPESFGLLPAPDNAKDPYQAMSTSDPTYEKIGLTADELIELLIDIFSGNAENLHELLKDLGISVQATEESDNYEGSAVKTVYVPAMMTPEATPDFATRRSDSHLGRRNRTDPNAKNPTTTQSEGGIRYHGAPIRRAGGNNPSTNRPSLTLHNPNGQNMIISFDELSSVKCDAVQRILSKTDQVLRQFLLIEEQASAAMAEKAEEKVEQMQGEDQQETDSEEEEQAQSADQDVKKKPTHSDEDSTTSTHATVISDMHKGKSDWEQQLYQIFSNNDICELPQPKNVIEQCNFNKRKSCTDHEGQAKVAILHDFHRLVQFDDGTFYTSHKIMPWKSAKLESVL